MFETQKFWQLPWLDNILTSSTGVQCLVQTTLPQQVAAWMIHESCVIVISALDHVLGGLPIQFDSRSLAGFLKLLRFPPSSVVPPSSVSPYNVGRILWMTVTGWLHWSKHTLKKPKSKCGRMYWFLTCKFHLEIGPWLRPPPQFSFHCIYAELAELRQICIGYYKYLYMWNQWLLTCREIRNWNRMR